LRAIRRFRRQIAAGALIQPYTIFLLLSDIFLHFSRIYLKANENTLVTVFEKGYLPPVVSAPKGIKFLYAICRRVLATACKIQKIHEN
jgi:hypothetical protein